MWGERGSVLSKQKQICCHVILQEIEIKMCNRKKFKIYTSCPSESMKSLSPGYFFLTSRIIYNTVLYSDVFNLILHHRHFVMPLFFFLETDPQP